MLRAKNGDMPWRKFILRVNHSSKTIICLFTAASRQNKVLDPTALVACPSRLRDGQATCSRVSTAIKYHELIPKKEKSLTDKVSLHDNLLICGDNLKALKALLPLYAGKIKFICIDPPYNTGNEKWVYNDNVNSPMMQEWLGKEVDREDLTRHDKWLCMMTPRLKLFRELLARDGIIAVTIDDNEAHRLGVLMDEVFGEHCRLACAPWLAEPSGGKEKTGLRGFNPCMIAELSATPSQKSNVLVDISGRELHREEMIKLDLHVVNKVSPDWKDTLLAGVNKRNILEQKAREFEANSGVTIRPICLIQAERTGKEQRGTRYIHSEDVREQLIKTIGIPAEQVAVKTSEKDELKEVDDIGGLMSRDCKIRYIITKQALQEGWDCAFAYVLVVLTNPASKNALTQLVGRILRQPGARKTKIRELDESYVLCFKQNANKLLASIRDGFGREGLGDLKNQIVRDMEEAGEDGEPPERTIKIRERFRRAANSTILPVFMVRRNKTWEPVNYEMDIAAKIPWDNVDLDPIFSLALSMYEEKDMEHIATLSDDIKKVIEEKEAIQLKEGGIRVDPVFMTRQICDIVPNPWMAHEFARDVLTRLTRKHDYKVVAANFVFIIEELRKQLEREKDRLSENIFKQMLASDQMRFLVIGDKFDFTFPKSIKVKPAAKTLNRKDGRQLQLSLFEFVPEDDFNETEKAVAWYLEGQKRLFFWYRNRSRQDYAIQGWRKHKIYPDFIFTATASEDKDDYEQVYVVETKGLHLIGSEDTDYKRKMFSLCTTEAKEKSWTELGPAMKDKVLRFEVLAEDEWQAKLNEMLQS